MKLKLAALMLLTGAGLMAGPRVFIGVGIGGGYYPPPVVMAAPPPPPAYAYYQPSCPGPGYSWVAGYWYPAGPRYRWRAGYWARPPYAHAYWIRPNYHHGRYYHGYWRH